MTVFLEAGLLALMMVMGIVCTWTDFRDGIIPNRILGYGVAAGTIFHIVFLIRGHAEYYPNWLLCMAIADALSFLMYYCQLWAAGDAKMFMTMYYLVPPMFLDAGSPIHGVIPYIFIFMPAFAWILIDSLIHLIRREPRKKRKMSWRAQLSAIGCIMIESTAAYAVLNTLFPKLIAENEMIITLLLMVYAYFCGNNRHMKKWYVVGLHAMAILITWMIGTWRINLPDWKTYILLMLIFGVQQFVSLYNYQLISTSRVTKGMIPSMDTIMKFQKSRVHHLPQNPSEELNARITETEADAIRRWSKTSYGEPNIWIVRKTPFAIMITIGFISWMMIKIGW